MPWKDILHSGPRLKAKPAMYFPLWKLALVACHNLEFKWPGASLDPMPLGYPKQMYIDLPIATGGSSKKQIRKQEQKQAKWHQSQALGRWMVAMTCWCLNVYHFTQRACLFFIIFHLRHIVVFQHKDIEHNKSCNWGDLHLLRIFVQVDVKNHSPFSFCLWVPISVG